MNDDLITDLKQFIAATVSQATSDLATKDDVKQLREEMQEGFAGVADAIEAQTSDLDQRVTKLEEKLA